MANLNINTSNGVVTSTNTSQLNIVTQTGAHGWNNRAYATQAVSGINRITVHHTGWDADGAQTATLQQFNNWWPRDWYQSGYHFIIQANGTVWQTTQINRVANGATPHNMNNIHIALVGLFWDGVGERPRRNPPAPGQLGTLMAGPALYSAQQQTALQRLIQGLFNNSSIPIVTGNNHVFGHRDLSGHESNACPGLTRANLHATITPPLPPAPPQPTIPMTFRVSRGNTFVGTIPNGGQIGNVGAGGTFNWTGDMQISGNWTWLRGRLSGTHVNPNTLVWVSTSQLERAAGPNGMFCQITDPHRFGFTSVRNNPFGPNIFNFTGNATFRPLGRSITTGGFNWRLGTIVQSNISALNNTTVWVASSQFDLNSVPSFCR